jgi:hypothetical protein
MKRPTNLYPSALFSKRQVAFGDCILRTTSRSRIPCFDELKMNVRGACYQQIINSQNYICGILYQWVFLVAAHESSELGLFKEALFSDARRRSTFFTSSAAARLSGRMPRSSSVLRTASLLVMCSFEIALSLPM